MLVSKESISKYGKDALEPLYRELKPQFLRYMLHYNSDINIRLDAFHEAMIAFYEYCLKGKYDPNKSSPKTMIFRMGRAYLINRLKKENRTTDLESSQVDKHIQALVDGQLNFELNEHELEVKNAMKKLGEKCRDLLQLFFYYNYTIDVIKGKMNYKNTNVVSSHKSRCIKKLKEILKS